MTQNNDAAVLHEGAIKDWRIADQSADELSAMQREAWNYKVLEGPYGGLIIDLTGPDGSSRTISLEVDMGNVHATVSGVAEEAHAIVKIGKDETVVEASTPQRGKSAAGVRFGKDGLVLGNTELDPGCVEPAAIPTT